MSWKISLGIAILCVIMSIWYALRNDAAGYVVGIMLISLGMIFCVGSVYLFKLGRVRR